MCEVVEGRKLEAGMVARWYKQDFVIAKVELIPEDDTTDAYVLGIGPNGEEADWLPEEMVKVADYRVDPDDYVVETWCDFCKRPSPECICP